MNRFNRITFDLNEIGQGEIAIDGVPLRAVTRMEIEANPGDGFNIVRLELVACVGGSVEARLLETTSPPAAGPAAGEPASE